MQTSDHNTTPDNRTPLDHEWSSDGVTVRYFNVQHHGCVAVLGFVVWDFIVWVFVVHPVGHKA